MLARNASSNAGNLWWQEAGKKDRADNLPSSFGVTSPKMAFALVGLHFQECNSVGSVALTFKTSAPLADLTTVRLRLLNMGPAGKDSIRTRGTKSNQCA